MAENVSWHILLSYCVRMFIISVGGQVLGIIACNALLKRRRSLVPLMTWLVMKYICMICILEVLVGSRMEGNAIFELVNYLLYACAAVMTAFMFYFTFHGSVIKCFTAMNISEILTSVFMLTAVLIVNVLQGRENLFLFQAEFQISDCLILVIEGILFGIFYHFAENFMKRFRTYHMKHERVFWVVYIIYFALVQLTSIGGISDNTSFMITIYMVFLISAVTGTLVLCFIYMKFRSGIRMERAYLGTQLGLLETHYKSIQSQMQQMEYCQRMIDEQMAEITGRVDIGESMEAEQDTLMQNPDRKERIQQYLEALKQEYHELQAGMYCDNWSVDAVLYCQIEAARQMGIEVECLVQGYDSQKSSPRVFAQVLFLLLHYGNSESQKLEGGVKKKMRLKTGRLQNQMVVEFYSSVGQKKSFEEKKVKQCVKDYAGTVTVIEETEGISVVVTMKCRE